MTQSIMLFRPHPADTPATIRERASEPAGESRLDAEIEKVARYIDLTVGESAEVVGSGTIRVTVPPHRLASALQALAEIAIDKRWGLLDDRHDFMVLTGFESERFHFSTFSLAVPAGSARLIPHWVSYVERRAMRGAEEALIVHDSEDTNGTTFIQTHVDDDGATWVIEISSPHGRDREFAPSASAAGERIRDWMATEEAKL